jgi:hypothetical protein
MTNRWGRFQDEILYALQEECKSHKGLELDGIHIRVWYYLLVVLLFGQAVPLSDMSCTNPDNPSRPAVQRAPYLTKKLLPESVHIGI